jgi:ribosomal protein S18 acetylase RimI-like enzyme
MALRSYRGEDWAAVREIYDLSKPDEMHGVVEPSAILPLESDQNMMALFRDSHIVVAEESNRVIGFSGNRGTFITWLFVHPLSRRKGIATALICEILGRVDRPVTLNVVVSNIPALALYRRNGFTIEREFLGQFQGIPCKVAKLRHEAAA